MVSPSFSSKPVLDIFSPTSNKISNSKGSFGKSLLSRQKTETLEGVFSSTDKLRKTNAFILPQPKIEFKNAKLLVSQKLNLQNPI